MSCLGRIELSLLIDYWCGELRTDEEEDLEEHVFDCSACAARLESISAMDEGIRDLIRHGKFGLPITRPLFEQFERDGLVMRQYRMTPGASVACTVGREDHFGVSWIFGDLSDAERVDVEFLVGGQRVMFVEDVPFDRDRGEVGIAASGDYLRTLPAHVFEVIMMAETKQGTRRVGTYTMAHTPLAE